MTGTDDTGGRPTNCAEPCLTWLCKYLLYGLAGVALVVGAVIFILWEFGPGVIFLCFPRPHVVASTVDSASLAQFTLSPNSSSLEYNLTLGMIIHNPNKRLGLYYHKVKSVALFQDQGFGYAQLDDFYQHTRNTTHLTMAFQGNQLIDGDTTASNFRSQQAAGVFSINVELRARLGKVLGNLEADGPKLKITCPLSLPAPGTASTAARFKPVDCTCVLVSF